jgi:hypothetical protein
MSKSAQANHPLYLDRLKNVSRIIFDYASLIKPSFFASHLVVVA